MDKTEVMRLTRTRKPEESATIILIDSLRLSLLWRDSSFSLSLPTIAHFRPVGYVFDMYSSTS
jgi:hypothetical protein